MLPKEKKITKMFLTIVLLWKVRKSVIKLILFGCKNDKCINIFKKLSVEDCQSKNDEKLIVYFSFCLFSFRDIRCNQQTVMQNCNVFPILLILFSFNSTDYLFPILLISFVWMKKRLSGNRLIFYNYLAPVCLAPICNARV